MPSKYKNSDKISEKLNGREWKASPRHGSSSSAVSANAYNPYSGTFHAVAPDPGTVNYRSRFKDVEDGDENASSIGASAEYDSVSNNESCSGESEDQSQVISKEKHEVAGSGSPPCLRSVSGKRDKTRWKNEKKHQRQKERRAKDLKDRSTGYLMSRKLEFLAEQLVSMGFPQDRATMALISNEGHVERSVSWLLEGGDEQLKEAWKIDSDLKIDISEELARIAELEILYKYPRTEVERAIIACQGNVDMVTEWLRDHCPILPEFPAKVEKENAVHHGTSILQKSDCLSTESVSTQLQPDKDQHYRHPPAKHFEAASGAGSLVKNAGIDPEKLKLSPESAGRVVDRKLQTSHSVPLATRSISNCVDLTDNVKLSSQLKDMIESKQFKPERLDANSQPAFEIQHSAQTSASDGDDAGCTVSDPSILSHSTLHDLKNYSSASTPLPSNINPKAVTGTSFPGVKFHRSNSALFLETEESFSVRNTITVSETAFCSRNSDFSAPNSSNMLPLSSEFSTGWAFGAPGEYLDCNTAAMGIFDYRAIDWSMQPPASDPTETGPWGIHQALATTSNLPDNSQVQIFPTDPIASFQNASLCVSFSTNLCNSIDLWADAKLRRNLKTSEYQEIDSAHCLSSSEEWTSPFDGKDLFILSHQTVSSPSL